MNFKKIVGKGLALVALSTYFASSTTSAYAAESTESLKADAAEKLSILQDQQQNKQTLEAQIDSAESKLQGIQSSMNSVGEEIEQVRNQISTVKEQIEENKEEIVKLDDSVNERQSLIEDRLVAMQQNSKDNVFLDILLNSESIVDMLQKAYSVFVIFDADKEILEAQQSDIDQLEKVKAEIEANEQTLEERQLQLEEKQDELKGLEEDQQNTLQEVQTKYKKVNSEIELTKAEQEKIEAKIVALETAAKEEAQLVKTVAKTETTESNTDSSTTEKKEESTSSSTTEKKEESASSSKPESTNSSTSSNQSETAGTTQNEGKSFYVTATAYTPAESTTGKTALGYDVWANPNMKLIAVDPSVIPLGSRVYVEGYGEAIAGDTGGAIKGKKIDILMPTVREALLFGRQTVKVTVLD